MEQEIIRIIAETKEDDSLIEKIKPDSNIIHEAEFSSLQLINFVIKLEQSFSIEIDFDEFEIENLSTVGAIKEFVEATRERQTVA